MIPPLAPSLRDLLGRADFCHVATSTPTGPHVTPMVFAVEGDRLWVTTSRGSVKARAWRADARIAGYVRAENEEVVFTGTVATFDLLDPESWGRSARAGLRIARAAARFTRKNARFFAGYAVDAHRVPLAWTPPGRVFAELRPDRWATLGSDAVTGSWGAWGGELAGVERFRSSRAGASPLEGLPVEVGRRLGTAGAGVLALETPDGPVALPARWVVDGSSVYAVLAASTLALARAASRLPAALQIDRPSWWRARAMIGAMIRGEGEIAIADELTSGARSAARIVRLAGLQPAGACLVRLRAGSLVWWRGWSTGTARLP
jgi:nitroimidazol reductase NimA-like FMN-containing flavoprotein (pyridoxamine 5'-phosphate oxidase superfamily)